MLYKLFMMFIFWDLFLCGVVVLMLPELLILWEDFFRILLVRVVLDWKIDRSPTGSELPVSDRPGDRDFFFSRILTTDPSESYL